MSAQVALIIAGLAFIAAAVAGGGDFVNIRLPKLPTRARYISAAVGATAFILGLMPAVYTPSTPAIGAPTSGASTQPPTSPSHGPSISQSPATVPAAEAVTIDHPDFGTTVGECAVFSGRASLPQDDTLVLSVLNTSDPAKVLYLQPVNDWDKPAQLSHWTGYQYFGSRDSSVGQTYEVSAVIMKVRTVNTALGNPANRPIWHVKTLPQDSAVKQTLRVIRAHGSGPAVCQ